MLGVAVASDGQSAELLVLAENVLAHEEAGRDVDLDGDAARVGAAVSQRPAAEHACLARRHSLNRRLLRECGN